MRLLDPRLKAFLKIAQIGTVFGAGDALGLTQTAVTQRIRSLENELGVTLFTRSRKGMRLTTEGQALQQYCRGAEELEGAVFSKLSGGKGLSETHLTIAGPTSAMSSQFVKSSIPVMKKYPGLFLHMVIDDLINRVDLVRTDQAQLALVPPNQVPLEMDSKLLTPDRYVLVCSPVWRGRKLEEILAVERIIDFYESDLTTLNYLKKFGLAALVKRPRLYVNHNLPLIELLVAGLGYGTLTENVAKPYLDSGSLMTLNRGRVLEDPLALVWYPRPHMPDYFKATIQSIK
jgi:DNA-binding transcriptional LysR family regulator